MHKGVLPVVVAAGLGACSPSPARLPELPVALTAGSQPAIALDDASIATVAISVADGQAAIAEVAGRQAVDPKLRAFAEQVVASYPAATIETLSLAPRASVLQDEVTAATNGDLFYLDATPGRSFDRAFLDTERRALADAIRLLDMRLVPAAVSPHLRQALARMRLTLEEELRAAAALEALRASAPDPTAPP